MTFRRPLRQKAIYPIVLCATATAGYALYRSPLWARELIEPGIYVLMLMAGCVYWSWEAWTARIDVDRWGVRWREGEHTGKLHWEDISGLARDGMILGLVDQGEGRTLHLPFYTRPLYDALADRLRPLKPEEERILFSEVTNDD